MLKELIQEQMDKMPIVSEEWNELLGLRIHASLIDKWMEKFGSEKFMQEELHILEELDRIRGKSYGQGSGEVQ